MSEYPADDPTPSYKLYVNNQGKDIKPQYNTFSVKESFHQSLENQLGYSKLDDRSRSIALFIIDSVKKPSNIFGNNVKTLNFIILDLLYH